jgi:uncharacterized OB-fold protein
MTSAENGFPPLRRSAEAQPYWAGLRRGELLYQRCADCGPIWFPRFACPRCLRTDISWHQAAGTGRLFSYSIVHHAADPYWKARVPYGVGVAAVDEGYHIFGHVALSRGAEGQVRVAAQIGEPVRIRIVDRDASPRLLFEPR